MTAVRKIFFYAGPGDVIRVYQEWQRGRHDPSQVAQTYSSQFFEQAQALQMRSLVYCETDEEREYSDSNTTIVSVLRKSQSCSGLAFYWADLKHWIAVQHRIIRFGARVAVISDCDHIWMLVPLRAFGISIVPSVHCTLWPKGFLQMSLARHLNLRLNGAPPWWAR